jgi:hypothetical protein
MEDYYEPVINKEISLKEKIDKIYSNLEVSDKKEVKKVKLKIPRRAKVSKSRLKKGYVGLLFVNPNKVIKGEKVKLESGTYETKDGNYHYTDGHEIVWWEGKYPLLWQRYDKTNPTNLVPKEGDKNEIYGQEQIKLRMKSDLIKDKGKGGGMSIIIIIAVLIGGYFLLKMLFPKLFGG